MPEGKSTIENGLSLCKLHHSAYDAFIIGVTPDYIIQVRADILEEEDGPVLQHGLKGLGAGGAPPRPRTPPVLRTSPQIRQ
ncbi:MAG: hypothetical protein IPI86_08170 [Anaerolineales bacterium]|nr:hypothetical protein [Anaerolineales bacterium]